MRKPTVYVALATVVIVGLVACSQPDGSSNNPPLSPTTHVYIAGKVGNSTNNILPVYWKDGVINYLQLSPTYTNGWAVGITVDKAGNVYVQGGQWIINTSTVVYGYWKGSSFTPLTVPPAYTTLWEEGIAVDTSGNVWLAYTVGSSSPPIIPTYWENSGSPLSLPNATNVCNVGADTSGDVYFIGTTGGTSRYASSESTNWTPTVWKNGSSASALTLTGGNAYGIAEGWALDASGNLYTSGQQWSVSNVPIYWKAVGGAWGSPTTLNVGSYSGSFAGTNGLAVDSSGNVDCEDTTATSSLSSTNGYYTSPGTLIYWKGASTAPATLPLLSGYTYWNTYFGSVDAAGNYFVAGALAATSIEAANDTGIPVFWENGGSPVQLQLGSNGGVANTYGRAFWEAVGP